MQNALNTTERLMLGHGQCQDGWYTDENGDLRPQILEASFWWDETDRHVYAETKYGPFRFAGRHDCYSRAMQWCHYTRSEQGFDFGGAM